MFLSQAQTSVSGTFITVIHTVIHIDSFLFLEVISSIKVSFRQLEDAEILLQMKSLF